MSGRPRLGDFFSNRQEPGRPGLPVMSVTMNDSLVLRDDLDRRTDSALRPDQHLLVRKGDIAYKHDAHVAGCLWAGHRRWRCQPGLCCPGSEAWDR